MQTMRTQLAVIGGGPAGVCAAIAAAQRGVQTALVTDRPVLGGNSSSEIHVWTRGARPARAISGRRKSACGASWSSSNLYRNSDANPVFRDETLLDAVLREKNLTLLLNTEIYGVELDGGRVAALRGVQQSSERQFHIEADYFIDATGDGTVSAKAGVPFSVGNGNHETLGNSILYYTRREDHPVSFIAPDYAYDMSHIEKILGCGGRIINERMSGSDCWSFEANPLVSLAVCERARIGFLCGQTGEPEVYEPRAWYPDAALYGAEQLVSGDSRPWGRCERMDRRAGGRGTVGRAAVGRSGLRNLVKPENASQYLDMFSAKRRKRKTGTKFLFIHPGT